ncbi:MAG: hypothetical protein V9F82_05125 [Dermatophilaceae bacterium]
MDLSSLLASLALAAPVVWLLERTHRRTRHLPRLTHAQRRGIAQWW